MFKEEIAELLSGKVRLNKEQILELIEVPPNPEFGDYSFPCFVLANSRDNDEMWENVEKDFFKKKSPVEIAKHFEEQIKPTKSIEKIKAMGPYVNFFINKLEFAKKILKINRNFGKAKQSGRIMIEFSQPNTHKAFHVGHIRGTSLGESLSRINEMLGKKVVRANYSGDTGMHIAKWIWCYLNYHSKEKLKDDEAWIASIYVDAVKRLAKNEKLQGRVDEINRKIDEKTDKKINELWKKTRELSIKSWNKIYDELGTRFDRHYFESEVEASGKKISNEILEKGIAEKSEDAVIMNLEKYNLGIWVLLRKDGTVLYSAKEIALTQHKLKDQNLDKFIIISGDEQNFHFKQLFKTLELMKVMNRDKFEHLGFGMVRLPHGKMSSRTGDNILYSNFKQGVFEFAKKGVAEKWKKLSRKELEIRALKIAMGSIKYSMLSQDPNKPIIFDKEKALQFEGNTGPYLQYSYARASSIIRKANSGEDASKKPLGVLDKSTLKTVDLTGQEYELIKKISKFPEIVEKAGQLMNPSLIANYSFELAQLFNEFYHSCKVIGDRCEGFRLRLVDSFRTCLKNALYLLGIEVMEEM